MNRDPLTPLILATALVLTACSGGGDDGPDGKDDDPSTDTDVTTDDTDVEQDSDAPTFPPGTFQLRVMNLSPNALDVTGTDVDGAAFDYDVDALSLSDFLVFPVGDTTLDFSALEPYNLVPISGLGENERAVIVIGEVAGVTFPMGFREPARAPGSRTLVLATTGRNVGVDTEAGRVEVPAGDEGEVRTITHSFPNDQASLTWYTYGKPYRFTTARLPEDGVGFVVNSNLANDGWGTYYFAHRAGPVVQLSTDLPLYAYSADSSMTASLSLTAATPFGDVTVAENIGYGSLSALPYAYVPADTTSLVASDGVKEVTLDLPEPTTAEHAIAVVHQVGGVSALEVLWGEPNDRQASDGYMTVTNLTDSRLTARCYWGFGGAVDYGGVLGTTLIAPANVLLINNTQRCNLAVAEPPADVGADPTHDYDVPTSRIRGYHKAFVEESGGAYRFHYAYRITDDPNVYMNNVSVTAR